MSPGAEFLSIFLSLGRNFAKVFCPGAGNLTTLKNSPEVSPGGCWCLELTDALSRKSEACWIENEMGSDEILITFMWVNIECNAMRILGIFNSYEKYLEEKLKF